MSSSYLLNLKINQLQQEVQGIGNSVGYFWNATSVNGLIVDGGDTAINISAPGENGTAYCYSNVIRNDVWSSSAKVPTSGSNNMFIGVAEDINANFPGASYPSMKMVNYGVMVEINPGNAGYTIINGVQSGSAFTVQLGDTIGFNYNGTTFNITVNGTVYYTTSTTLGPVSLIAGSWYGGQLNEITWLGSSTGSGGGSTVNLQEVLTNGNNGGNQDILNIRNLNLNNYLNIGNAVGNTSQIHMCWDTGNTTTGNNVQLVASNDGTDYSQFEIQFYKNNALDGKPLKINNSLTEISTEVQATSFTLSANNNPVLDAIENPPIYFFTIDYTSGADTKSFNTNTATSIMSFNLSNLYSFYTVRMDTLLFTLDVLSAPTPSGTITAQFYLTNVLNGQPTNDANFVSFTTGNLNPVGGSPNFSLPSSKILCATNSSNSSTLYLNVIVKATPAAAATYKLANFNIQGEGQASPSGSGLAPATMLT